MAIQNYMQISNIPSVQNVQNTQAPGALVNPPINPQANPAGVVVDVLTITSDAQAMYDRHVDAMDSASGVCNTCATRAYVCSSGAVSRPSAGNATAYVVAHEQAHLADDRADAQAEGNRVVMQNIAIFSATCPECGVIYTSGGEARSLIASESAAGADHPMLEVMEGACGPDGTCCGCGCCGSLA